MKRYLVTTALAALLAAGPAVAAEQSTGQAPAATPPTTGAKEPGMQGQTGSLQFVSVQKETDWLANNLIGRSVKNSQGDTLGDINDVVLDEGGQVAAVLIGVGGFLGIGEKVVGIDFDSLEFKQAPKPAPLTTTAPPSGSPGASGGNPLASAAREPGSSTQADRPDPAHSNMVIVLNATKEQLENAPAFVRLGEEADKTKASDRLTPETNKKQ